MDENVINFSNGDLYLWVEQSSSIQIKAVTKQGDPVELNAEEARDLADQLKKLADKIDE